MYHKLVILDSEMLSKDFVLLKLLDQLAMRGLTTRTFFTFVFWLFCSSIVLHLEVEHELKIILFRRTDIEEFAFVYRPYESTGNLATDILVYFCHLNIANRLQIIQ